MVLKEIPWDFVQEVIVCNNNSKDRTKEVALSHGATVVDQPLPGYGNACLKGLEYLKNKPAAEQPDIIVFLDGDLLGLPTADAESSPPNNRRRATTWVIGSRALGDLERGAMQPQQIFGNWLATNLIRLFFKYHFTDLGPFRANPLGQAGWDLKMADKNFGWTVEMQVKAAKQKLKCTEVAVDYRKRVGVSKVSGTIKGSILAGHKILWTIFKSI